MNAACEIVVVCPLAERNVRVFRIETNMATAYHMHTKKRSLAVGSEACVECTCRGRRVDAAGEHSVENTAMAFDYTAITRA